MKEGKKRYFLRSQPDRKISFFFFHIPRLIVATLRFFPVPNLIVDITSSDNFNTLSNIHLYQALGSWTCGISLVDMTWSKNACDQNFLVVQQSVNTYIYPLCLSNLKILSTVEPGNHVKFKKKKGQEVSLDWQ